MGEKTDEVMDIRITDGGRQLLARTKRFALAGYLGLLFLIVNTGKFKTRKSEDFGSFQDDILGLLYGDVFSCQIVTTTFHSTIFLSHF